MAIVLIKTKIIPKITMYVTLESQKYENVN